MFEPAYKKLLTYKYCSYVYILNKDFIKIFLPGWENMRQRQQMDQAARSAKQCLAEGATQKTSLKGYIKMLGVSRGSLEELLEDFKDIAMENRIEIWDKERLRRQRGMRIFIPNTLSSSTFSTSLPPPPPLPQDIGLVVNIMIDLITRTNYLLDQQRSSLEQKHMKEGGYNEQLYRKRKEYRGY